MKKMILAVVLLVSGVMGTVAQEKGTYTVGADVVSSYVWRGMFQNSNACFQPTLSWSYKGLTLGAWGSTDINIQNQEFDLSVAYSINGFRLSMTDYWWSGEKSNYFDYKRLHLFEGGIGYSFGFGLTLSASTIFAADADKELISDPSDPTGIATQLGDQYYSTYLEVIYNFKVGEIDLSASLGATPMKGMYSFGKEGFQVASIGLKGTKTLKITESFSVPLFVQAVVAPAADHTHLVVGATF